MHGLHLTADLYRCRCELGLLTDAARLAALCRRHVESCVLTVVGERWHAFPGLDGQPGGVTGALLLAESHLAVHTWPEQGGVTLDIYVCNVSADNSGHAERLQALLLAEFQPGAQELHRLRRGGGEP